MEPAAGVGDVAQDPERVLVVREQRLGRRRNDHPDHGAERESRRRQRGARVDERHRGGEEREHRHEVARPRAPTAERVDEADVVTQDERRHAGDDERLGTPSAPVQHHEANDAQRQDRHEPEGAAGEEEHLERGTDARRRDAVKPLLPVDAAEALDDVVAALPAEEDDVRVREVRERPERPLVVGEQREDACEDAGGIDEAATYDRRAGDRVEPQHEPNEGERVLRRDGESGEDARGREERRARRPRALAPQDDEGREAEARRKDVREEEARERQEERPGAEGHGRSRAEAALPVLPDPAHEQEEGEGRKGRGDKREDVHAAREPERVQHEIERQGEERDARRLVREVVAVVPALVAGEALVVVDPRRPVGERLHERVVRSLVEPERLEEEHAAGDENGDREQAGASAHPVDPSHAFGYGSGARRR